MEKYCLGNLRISKIETFGKNACKNSLRLVLQILDKLEYGIDIFHKTWKGNAAFLFDLRKPFLPPPHPIPMFSHVFPKKTGRPRSPLIDIKYSLVTWRIRIGMLSIMLGCVCFVSDALIVFRCWEIHISNVSSRKVCAKYRRKISKGCCCMVGRTKSLWLSKIGLKHSNHPGLKKRKTILKWNLNPLAPL